MNYIGRDIQATKLLKRLIVAEEESDECFSSCETCSKEILILNPSDLIFASGQPTMTPATMAQATMTMEMGLDD